MERLASSRSDHGLSWAQRIELQRTASTRGGGDKKDKKDAAEPETRTLFDILAENVKRARQSQRIVAAALDEDAIDVDQRDGGEYDANRWLAHIHNRNDEEECEADEEDDALLDFLTEAHAAKHAMPGCEKTLGGRSSP